MCDITGDVIQYGPQVVRYHLLLSIFLNIGYQSRSVFSAHWILALLGDPLIRQFFFSLLQHLFCLENFSPFDITVPSFFMFHLKCYIFLISYMLWFLYILWLLLYSTFVQASYATLFEIFNKYTALPFYFDFCAFLTGIYRILYFLRDFHNGQV